MRSNSWMGSIVSSATRRSKNWRKWRESIPANSNFELHQNHRSLPPFAIPPGEYLLGIWDVTAAPQLLGRYSTATLSLLHHYSATTTPPLVVAARCGRHSELFGANRPVFRGNSLVAVTRRSKGWSESIRTAVNSAQRIRSIRFTNLHPNEVGFSPYQSAETRNELISISRYYGNRPLSV